jgi:predicted enzyme related to lactoylglutathione lyase
MKIRLTSVFVNDQEKALQFYANVLGFSKKQDVSLGQYRWLTVVSPDEPDGVELLLEPNENPIATTYQQALFQQGIPAAIFFVDNIQEEYARMRKMGVDFSMEPTATGPVTIAIFDDTCGNRIQLNQV